MAESRREVEDEGERKDVFTGRPTTDQPARSKPEHLHSSQGPLSSIRAAIKRTKLSSQSDSTRDRRRPAITIVSAEPLVGNDWFSRTSGVFPPAPPQSGWSTGLQVVPQPPPSYDQVIKEKTEADLIVRPTAAPRRNACTATCSTQTDSVRKNSAPTVPQRSITPLNPAKTGKKPKKPPRPSLPTPANRKVVSETDLKVEGDTSAEDPSGSKCNIKLSEKENSTNTCIRSVTVHWDIPKDRLPVLAAPVESTPSSTTSEHSLRPVPRPRTKTRKQPSEEESKVLVKLGENRDSIQTDPPEASSNKYLKELLEVFSAESECGEDSDIIDQTEEASQAEDAVSGMNNNSHDQRNIRARIQAFESQAASEGEHVYEVIQPRPLPRTSKPPVYKKPSVALKPQFPQSRDDNQNIPSTDSPQIPTLALRPQPPNKPMGFSIKEELEMLHSKGAIQNGPHRSVLTRADRIDEDAPPALPTRPVKEPLKPNMNINNHNSVSTNIENQFVNNQSNQTSFKSQQNSDGASYSRESITKRPTTIGVPSRANSMSDSFQYRPPPLPSQKPVGSLKSHGQSLLFQESSSVGPQPSLPPRRHSVTKPLPPRPSPAKSGPGRPAAPSAQALSRSQSVPWETSSVVPQQQRSPRNGPVLPPRPSPGHRLYNKYTLQLPHGIASFDYYGYNTGELTFQKNEVLLILQEIDPDHFECQVGETKGRVHKSRMKVITPLDTSPLQGASAALSSGDSYGLKVEAMHDFTPEGPGELVLQAGDIVTMVEQVDSDWYKGTCRGSAGFFPINYVKVLSNSPKPLPEKKPKPLPASVSGPRCVARFDLEGEHSDELSFSEGDVIQLKEYSGQDWARGQIGNITGIFPLNFVEIIEDLPPTPSQQQQPAGIALPGMVAAPENIQPEVAKPAQDAQPSVEWVVALYDYAGKTDEDLSFQEGDSILLTRRIDNEWSYGRVNGSEGMFPNTFVKTKQSQQLSNNQQQSGSAGGGRAKALFNYTSDCEEELSLQAGDIITNLESIDEEWFLGELRGKQALVPKTYVQVLA